MSLGTILPAGFRYAAAYAGIRKVAKDDLALIVSDTPASAAAVFTKNLVVAAPVELARRNLRESRGRVRAWLINAGNANCATRTGERVALECVRSVAKTLGVQEQEVLPASTGVIGVEMNARLIVDTIPELAAALRPDSFDAVAAAIMTTDTRAKTAFAKMKRATVAGMAKGSGMIHPRMATTLGFVMTDAVASPAELRAALKKAIGVSFNHAEEALPEGPQRALPAASAERKRLSTQRHAEGDSSYWRRAKAGPLALLIPTTGF